jgi:peroxiredoxin
MADTTTATFGIGDPVPSFALPDTDGVDHAVPQHPAPAATVLVVTCNHCPYVIAWNPRLRRVAEEYAERGVRVLGINANDASRYPADSLEAMRRFVRDQSWPIPYLHDEDQSVARALGAEVTPHVFVLDREHRLVYRGAPDGDHRDEGRDAEWLRAALDATLDGQAPAEPETRARGCSVKWTGG